MKKTLAVLSAVLMAASLLFIGGCTQTIEPGDKQETRYIDSHQSADQAGNNPSLNGGQIELGEDLSGHWLCDEKTTLTVTTYDGVNSSYYPPSNDLWFWQFMEAYTNVHIDWQISPYAGYDEIVNTRLSAGVQLSDIFMMTGVRATQNAGDNGTFIDLRPYWDTCFTNTKAYFDKMGMDFFYYIQNPNGKIYSLPNTINPTEGHITFIYNTEWMKELGAEIPTTLDEFTDLLYKMQKAGDLNHNGFNDEVILTSSNLSILMSVLGNAFNLEQYEGWESFNADAEGNVYAEYTTENMRECLKYIHQLYNDGVLDNEIFYMSADDMGEKIAQDRVGIFVYYSGFAVSYGNLTTKGQEDPLGEWYTLGMPLASEWNGNEAYFMKRTTAYGNTGAAITHECSNPELAAKWLDVLYADPNVLWARVYGKEGETYTYDADKNVQLLYDEKGDWDPFYLGIGQISLPFIQTNEECNLDARQWYKDECDRIRECKWVSASVPKVSIFSEEEADIRDTVFSEVNAFWLEWRDKFVSGQADLEKNWDTYVNSINSMGMTKLTQVWQMVYDRLVK